VIFSWLLLDFDLVQPMRRTRNMVHRMPTIDPTVSLTASPTVSPQPIAPELIVRDPQAALQTLRAQWPDAQERWVFGYASLIWRPEFDSAEQRSALVHGWHRSLRMRSRVNRGTPQQPGLVFALLPGGACRGLVYRLRPDNAEEELARLWAREMPTGVYDARLLPCITPKGKVQALAFTLSRRSDSCLPPLADAEVLHILRHARGRYGTTLNYLTETAQALKERGIRDREIERLMVLARRHGLV
jgi:glutathione-specific gamma-glutamylcyclotransferase